jgi:hypothetical protein
MSCSLVHYDSIHVFLWDRPGCHIQLGSELLYRRLEKYTTFAIAASALFRSVIGGAVPVFTPMLPEKL